MIMENENHEEIGVSVTESDGHTFVLKQVRDSYDFTHIIRKELGRGGQGMVCLTEDKDIVVKFALDTKGTIIGKEKDSAVFKHNDAAFKAVALKAFPDRLHLARPVARLADYSGYVMRLMGDMTSFSEFVPIDNEDIERMASDGGHRRRFLLLSKLAALLAKLHGAGMVYCDISANNVFVTKSAESETQNVWLIDADNVFIPGEDLDKLVFTPRYVAPELIGNPPKPCSHASDCYSFAVLAFESLAALHPFKGKKAEGEDSGDDWDASVQGNDGTKSSFSEPDAFPEYSGKIPWVEDTEDDSNHTENGLPRQNFLTDETFRLFNATFSEEGRESPKMRPTAVLWARAFAHSYAKSVRCPDCGMSFVFDEAQNCCPWCEKKLPPLLTLSLHDEVVFAHEASFKKDCEGDWISLPEFLFEPFSVDTCFCPLIKLRTVEKSGRALEFVSSIESGGEHLFFISTEKGEEKIGARYTLFLQGGTYELRYENRQTGIQRTFSLSVKESFE